MVSQSFFRTLLSVIGDKVANLILNEENSNNKTLHHIFFFFYLMLFILPIVTSNF